MCGICGFVGRGTPEDLEQMNDAQVHRGPDGSGKWIDKEKNIFLGHRRLSIIDLDGGAQPMVSSEGDLVVVFNGEIYNHAELRDELQKQGHHFRTSHSDTEVLIYGYKQWGERLTERLNGMWAFAIYDKSKNSLFLSRDRFGKKPLYYMNMPGVFAFASELSALTSHNLVSNELDPLSVKKYFAYGYIPAPRSLYKNIYKLPGGHSLLLDCSSGQMQISRYWEFRLEPVEQVTKKLETQWCEQLRNILDRAVRLRLISDVTLGVFLSGGIDSTAVAYYAGKAQGFPSVKTLSVEFDDISFDESAYSRRAAAFLGTDHYARLLTLKSALEVIPDIACRLDEPMGDSSLIATFLLCKETRSRVTVALGGDGADELFAGYDPFAALRFARAYNAMVPRPVHNGICMLMARFPVSHVNMSMDFKIKRALRGLSFDRRLWNSVWLGPLSPPQIQELFTEKTPLEELYSEAIASWDRCTQPHIIDKTLQFYTDLYLQDDILVKVDRAGMLNSLEVRAPFLDVEMAKFAAQIPWRYKFRKGQGKYILKKAMEPVLPADIIYRKKKGFGVPLGRWFKEGKLPLREPGLQALLNERFIQKARTQHELGTHDNRAFLWNYFLMESFLKRSDDKIDKFEN